MESGYTESKYNENRSFFHKFADFINRILLNQYGTADFNTGCRSCSDPFRSQLACRRFFQHSEEIRDQRIRNRVDNRRHRHFDTRDGGKFPVILPGKSRHGYRKHYRLKYIQHHDDSRCYRSDRTAHHHKE